MTSNFFGTRILFVGRTDKAGAGLPRSRLSAEITGGGGVAVALSTYDITMLETLTAFNIALKI